MEAFLDFEKPIATLEKKLHDLRTLAQQDGVDLNSEIKSLEKKVDALIDETYGRLTPWQRVLLSRHPGRPYTRDYIEALFPTFQELHGDRTYGDDGAIFAGIAEWPPAEPAQDRESSPKMPNKVTDSIVIIGHQKGRSTKQKMQRNFGMARPEGYRKAMRLMELAERSRLPILTLIDTPGAYPDIEAEERGQSQAIAESIRLMFGLSVPIVSVVIGEGGSGGALAVGVANKVLMTEYSTYSVISPEGCASILWSDSRLAERASDRLKMNPSDLTSLEVIDGVIPEPRGGAHRDWKQMFRNMRKALMKHMDPMVKVKASQKGSGAKAAQALRMERITKYRAMGGSALGHTSGATPQ